MYLSNLKLWNFRKYGINGNSFENAEPGLSVSFNDGVNVLVGENDSEKRQSIFCVKKLNKTFASLEKRQAAQYADYQLHFASLEK